MATSSLNSSLHQSLHQYRRQQHSSSFTFVSDSCVIFSRSSISAKPFLSLSSSSYSAVAAVSATQTTTTSSSAAAISDSSTSATTTYDKLAEHLSAGDFREADEVTRRLLIELAGEAAQKRGYVFFSEVKFISSDDLRAIDALWRQHSGGKYGYSVQRRIWEKCRRDFTRFFIRVRWMKKLDTEVEQYNYRAFPDEFIWEMDSEVPEGHLPLTNALRGTQLLQCILTHPAFEDSFKEEKKDNGDGSDGEKDQKGEEKTGRQKPRLLKSLKPDYSF